MIPFLRLLFLLLLVNPAGIAAPFDCLAGYVAIGPGGLEGFEPKTSYHVRNNPKNPVSFGYEVEFFPDEAKGLINYYRVPEIPEATWLAMAPKERQEAVEKKILSVTKNDVALVRLSDAPKFLAEKAIRETTTDMRVEISDNQINSDLGEVFRQFDWIEFHIGKGYPQGHIAFKSEGVDARGAPTYLKLDGDLAMVNSISHSYRAYQREVVGGSEPGAIVVGGKRILFTPEGVTVETFQRQDRDGEGKLPSRFPARALLHRSLGPMDRAAFDTLSEWTTGEKIPDLTGMHRETKFNYGVVLRPDLYGENRSGFEVRNPGARFGDLKFRMAHLAETLTEGFEQYRGLEVTPLLVGPEALAAVSPRARKLYQVLGQHLADANKGQNFATPFGERFTFVHLDWSQHPYILALPPASQVAFKQKLKTATKDYERLIEKLPADPAVLPAVQVSIGKWAAQSDIRHYLEMGAKAAAKD